MSWPEFENVAGVCATIILGMVTLVVVCCGVNIVAGLCGEVRDTWKGIKDD